MPGTLQWDLWLGCAPERVYDPIYVPFKWRGWFDYGCGAAPYRGFFRDCTEYIGADVTPGPNVDRQLDADGLTEEPSGSYDSLLSTQVLEHVKDPEAYVRECHRILRPGGRRGRQEGEGGESEDGTACVHDVLPPDERVRANADRATLTKPGRPSPP